MNKKNIGLFVDSRRKSGGAYQELLYNISNFQKLNKEKYNIKVIFSSKNLDIDFKKINFDYTFIILNPIERFICFTRNFGNLNRRIKRYFFFKNKFEKFLKRNDIELVFFTGPSQYSLYLENTKFIITIPDVNHREFVEFPELVDDAEYQRKDEIFSKSLPRALGIITNAPVIKEKIIKIYGVEEKRVLLINHQPSLAVDNFKKIDENILKQIREEFSLKDNYIFYPAMYLPHKNHKTIIDTIFLLKNKFKKKYDVVFCGNDAGSQKFLRKYASQKKVDNQFNFLNFVDDEKLPYLYHLCSMLLMPPIIGPTMIPPWEAFKMKKPVIYSSLPGVKEVYHDCVNYIDPFNHEDIAKNIIQVSENSEIRNNLISKGFEKYQMVKKSNENEKIFKLIDNYFKIRSLWE